jgi:hypothetical protein
LSQGRPKRQRETLLISESVDGGDTSLDICKGRRTRFSDAL